MKRLLKNENASFCSENKMIAKCVNIMCKGIKLTHLDLFLSKDRYIEGIFKLPN